MKNLAAPLTVKPRLTQNGGGSRGPVDRRNFGGGSGGGHGDEQPDYAERLRRYRFGLALALVAIVLLFVTCSGAFLLHQGLGRWDPALGVYVHDSTPATAKAADAGAPVGGRCICRWYYWGSTRRCWR